MKTFIIWLLVSSKDPNKLSLFVKGFLGTVVTVLTMVFGLANVQVGDLTPIVDSIVSVVQAIAVLISAVVALVGLVRKVIATIKGQHAGLNYYE